jgi:hypothetical protein
LLATVKGDFTSLEKWDYEGKSGFTLCIVQSDEVIRIQCQAEDLANLPKFDKYQPTAINVRINRGYEGKGYKSRFVEMAPLNGSPASPK